ncbi:WUSCHEL-related homeobox 11 [Diospyros lotus]|uniref:WUSCHEL-related homeobox 11 n=1 Tax=Diospyros lotus TaxID=55363 RepID=UPI00225B497C|nr:WUSCHEL-related homeobox 11 [Diospyros lotus]
MDDPGQDPNNPSHGSERSEPVRTRWTPKPEQILILESIFNSGMVNPPKDETVRIRKLLEKFGSVGDANVFYWFQNRRSRSRRRQRQIQASLAGGEQQGQATSGEGAIQYGGGSPAGFLSSSSSCLVGSSSSCGVAGGDDLFSFSCQMGLPGAEPNSSMASLLCPSDTSNLQYQSGNCMAGFITVFINGVPTEVPRGQIDMKAMFGQDMVLVHSSGIPVPFNEYGLSVETLLHGESYFLVPRLG